MGKRFEFIVASVLIILGCLMFLSDIFLNTNNPNKYDMMHSGFLII
jgi:hypothetical protein